MLYYITNHAEGVYIINSEGIAYHQNEVLDIIDPKEDTRRRVMIYAYGDDIHDCVVIIYQSFGLDRKTMRMLGSEPPFADEDCADLNIPATANFCCLRCKQQWFVAI